MYEDGIFAYLTEFRKKLVLTIFLLVSHLFFVEVHPYLKFKVLHFLQNLLKLLKKNLVKITLAQKLNYSKILYNII